jgi:hypothetical protein
MPLRARYKGKDVFAFEFDKEAWDEFKASSKSEPLLMPCCDSRAIPKTSKLGTHFFSHKAKGECISETESQEHLFIKGLIAQSAKKAGWDATTELPGETPDGSKWIADVLCIKGNARVVFEVQLSRQSLMETRARQKRYKDSGIRCAWIASDKVFKKSQHLDSYIPSNKELPFFRIISPTVGVDPLVDEFDVPLSQFIKGMLQGNLSWVEEPWSYAIYYIDDVCWKCKKGNKQVCGYAIDWVAERAKTVPNASTVLKEMLDKILSNNDLAKLGLNTIAEASGLKGNAPGFPFCNHCLHCGSPQNNYYLMQKIDSPAYEEETEGFKAIEFISSTESTGAWVYQPEAEGRK